MAELDDRQTRDLQVLDAFERHVRRASADLAGYASEDALQTLLANWRQAVRDGTPLSEVIGDVGDVRARLMGLESDLRQLLARERRWPARRRWRDLPSGGDAAQAR